MNTDVVITIAKYLPVVLIAKMFSKNKALTLTIYSVLTNKTRTELLATNLPIYQHVIEILALTKTRFDAGFDQLLPKIVNIKTKFDINELLCYRTYRMDDCGKEWYKQAINNTTSNLPKLIKVQNTYSALTNLSEFRPDLFHQYISSNKTAYIYAVHRWCELKDITGLMRIYELHPAALQFCICDTIPEITNYIIKRAEQEQSDTFQISDPLLCHLAAQRRFDVLDKFYNTRDDWSHITVTLMATGYWGPQLLRFLARTEFNTTGLYFEIDYDPHIPYQLQPSIPDNWHELLLINTIIVAPALVLFAGILGRADVLTTAINYIIDNDFLFVALLFFTTNMFNLTIVQQRLPKNQHYHFNVNNGKILKINMTTMYILLSKYKCSFNQVPINCFDIIDFTNVNVCPGAITSILNTLAFMPTINLTLAQNLISSYSKTVADRKTKIAKFSSIIDTHADLWLQRKSLLIIAQNYFT